MPKKQNKPNAFLLFMLEWKKREEKKGRSFPNGLKDVQTDPECNEEWRNLSEHEKARFKAMEKTTKAQPTMTKRTGLGESISDIERARNQRETFLDNMNQYIHNLIEEAKKKKKIQDLKFFVIHINYFYGRIKDNNEIEYYPAEIAIAEFSLGEGITNVYNQIINEKVVLGYSSEAKEHSMNTHHIPPNAPFGKSNYKEIFGDICTFIKSGKKDGKLPPLFTMYSMETVYHPVKDVISRMAHADGKTDNYVLVYSFEELFTAIQNAVKEQSDIKFEPLLAKLEIVRDPFDYKTGLECLYHTELKNGLRHCSQHFVKRWIYQLCHNCCEPLDIVMIPGNHCPKESKRNRDAHGSQIGSLNSTLSCLSLNESRRATSVLSMTGVSSEYRQKVSERSYREELRRRAEANLKPIEIIDHSKLNSELKKPQEPIERPLRAPFTKNPVDYVDANNACTTDSESIDFSENSFPSVGRGHIFRKKRDDKAPGISYSSCLKLR